MRPKQLNYSSAIALLVWAALATNASFAQESWDAIYIGGVKVGFTHLSVEALKDRGGRDLRRVKFETELELARGRDTVRLSILYGTIETPEGQVLRLDTRSHMGQSVVRTYGDVVDGVMKLKLENNGRQQTEDVPWGADVRGPYGPEISLSQTPLAPGEGRDVPTYIPDLNRVCVTHLEAKGLEEIRLGRQAKPTPLLRVEQTVTDKSGKAYPDFATTLWVDSSGQILKSHTEMLGGVDVYRTTKEAALAQNGAFNLLAKSIISTKQKIANPQQSRHVVYRVTTPGDEPGEIFAVDARQKLTSLADGGATLEVRTVPAAEIAKGTDPAGEAFLRSNPIVASDDTTVVKHMKSATSKLAQGDPWSKAVAIENWVFQNIKKKNFQTAFATAAEVARNLEGDCTEHAVLTAAMCRAADIPSRCAIGLVYVADQGGFGPHMWNEVYIDGRWLPLDAAFDQTEVDATHIKLSDSSLEGVAPFEAFLPVLRVFGKLEIEPVEIR